MDLSEAIFESETLGDIEVLRDQILVRRNKLYEDACGHFKTENFSGAYDRLARLNVIEKKLALCDTASERLKNRKV